MRYSRIVVGVGDDYELRVLSAKRQIFVVGDAGVEPTILSL
jgi:hypothetical protein